MDDLSLFCCQNRRCVAYGSRGAGNLSVCALIGKYKNIRQLRCKTCGSRFSERKGTVFYRAHTPIPEVVSMLHHVHEGCGMRQTGRLTGHKEDTVIRYTKLAGRHAQALHEELVAFSPRTREVQFDEKWAFVLRKQQHCDPENADDHRAGDCWDHVAFDAENRLALGVVCGKRSATRVLELVRTVKDQLGGQPPRLITSDEFAAYATVLDRVFNDPPRPVPGGQGRHNQPGRRGRGQRGQRGRRGRAQRSRQAQRVRQARRERRARRRRSKSKSKRKLTYATVCKRRENGHVVEVQTNVVFGSKKSVATALQQSRASSAVNTAFIERHNATDRHRNARKARQTYRFSKDWDIHQAVTCFSYYTYNFCWPVRTLRQPAGRRRHRPYTPAMSARLTDHVWPLHEWLSRPIPGLSS